VPVTDVVGQVAGDCTGVETGLTFGTLFILEVQVFTEFS
jgi:hypothetical protein